MIEFNLNSFLNSISFVLDYAEKDILKDITNHSRRVSYIAVNIGKKIGLDDKSIFDLGALAILHDCGSGGFDYKKNSSLIIEHCKIGEKIVKDFPFFTNVTNVILYHHEYDDGTGIFQKKVDEIPLLSRIISLANTVENIYVNITKDRQKIIGQLGKLRDKKFDSFLVDAFISAQNEVKFWVDIQDYFIFKSLNDLIPKFSIKMDFKEIRSITEIISNIVDYKSEFTLRHSKGLSEKALLMSEFYKFDLDTKYQLGIAADLHDIGKLAISNNILDKNGKLEPFEFLEIKSHAYLTRKALENICGFEKITEWAANHHEKLNGRGYPLGKTDDELDFCSRILGCLDIYQALTEERPYRASLSHEKSISIMKSMSENYEIDSNIVDSIDKVFCLSI